MIEVLISKDSNVSQFNFVIKRDNSWFNNNNNNYAIVFKEPEVIKIDGSDEVNNMVREIIAAESTYGS